jgi:hypothetical protein
MVVGAGLCDPTDQSYGLAFGATISARSAGSVKPALALHPAPTKKGRPYRRPLNGGGSRIRTSELKENRFTVCVL